jgi:hypothetical protein
VTAVSRALACLALLWGGAAALDPATWPTGLETLRLLGSLVLLPAAMRLPSRAARVACGLAWGLLLVGTRTPLRPEDVAADFRTFYAGAQALFGEGRSPYTVYGVTAFPFPTFPLVWALSLGGRLDAAAAYAAFTLLQLALLGLLVALARRLQPGAGADPEVVVLQGALLVQPPVLAGLAWGNSGALGGACVSLALWAWLARPGRASRHAAAAALACAWMVKPQLLMSVLFFLVSAGRELRRPAAARSRAAAIGRLLIPWSAAALALSLLLTMPAPLRTHADFVDAARRWHTDVAASHANNLAPAARLASAAQRLLDVPVARSLPPLGGAVAVCVLLANLRSLAAGRRDALSAILPWLLSSLLWSPLIWDWYLTLVLAAPLVLVHGAAAGDRSRPAAALLPLWAGIACCTTASASLFPAGLLLLYGHALRARTRPFPFPFARSSGKGGNPPEGGGWRSPESRAARQRGACRARRGGTPMLWLPAVLRRWLAGAGRTRLATRTAGQGDMPIRDLLRVAIAEKEQVFAFRKGRLLAFCPHALASGPNGPYVLAFLVAMDAELLDLPTPRRWTWIPLAELGTVMRRPGEWFSGPPESRPVLRSLTIEVEALPEVHAA